MAFSTFVGASLGVMVKVTSNSIRRLPLRREPWDYPLCLLIGAYIGYKYPQLEQQMLEEVNEKRAAIEKPPLQLGGILDFKKWE